MEPVGYLLSVASGFLGGIASYEYRRYRNNSKRESEEKIQWYRDTRVLCDQIQRECIDLQGRVGDDYEELVEGPMSTLDERVQELKDHLSESPDDLDPNLKFKLKDVWVKYAMLDTGTVTQQDIENYPLPSVKKAKTDVDEKLQQLELGLVERSSDEVKNRMRRLRKYLENKAGLGS